MDIKKGINVHSVVWFEIWRVIDVCKRLVQESLHLIISTFSSGSNTIYNRALISLSFMFINITNTKMFREMIINEVYSHLY